MDHRIEAAAVRGLVPELTETDSITAQMDTAHLLVDEHLVGHDMSEDRLEQIELWLAAHFCSVVTPKSASEGAGPVSQNFQGSTALNFNVTVYGQQALILDTSGRLALLQRQAKGNKAVGSPSVTWMGRDSRVPERRS